MSNNYLREHLIEFFKEVSYFNGNLYVVEALIKSRSEQIKSDFPSYQKLWMTGTFFRDLSLFGADSNHFPTGYGYDVSTSTLEEQSLRSISYVCCSSIANIYEVFDSYLKNILASVYIHSDQKQHYKLKLEYETVEDVRQNLWQIKSDKGFLKVIRRISPFFKKYEMDNIWGFNIGTWYSMIDKLRHQFIHNRQVLSEEFCSNMKKTEEWKLFIENFTLHANGDAFLVQVSYGQTVKILSTFLEYSYLIFKSLSIDLGLDYEYDWQKAILENPIINVYPNN